MLDNQVRPKSAPEKSDVSAALSVSWARAARNAGKGSLADKAKVSTKTIDRALTGETVPELHTALASMLADESALDEVFALYGLDRPRWKHSAAANDLHTVSDLTGLASAFCRALEDGNRDHTETLELARLIRALKPALSAILEEADRIRGVAA